MGRIYLNPLPKIGHDYSGAISSIGPYGVTVSLDLNSDDYCGTTNTIQLHGKHRPTNPEIGERMTVRIISHEATGVYGERIITEEEYEEYRVNMNPNAAYDDEEGA